MKVGGGDASAVFGEVIILARCLKRPSNTATRYQSFSSQGSKNVRAARTTNNVERKSAVSGLRFFQTSSSSVTGAINLAQKLG